MPIRYLLQVYPNAIYKRGSHNQKDKGLIPVGIQSYDFMRLAVHLADGAILSSIAPALGVCSIEMLGAGE
jgi:hypothetical protein